MKRPQSTRNSQERRRPSLLASVKQGDRGAGTVTNSRPPSRRLPPLLALCIAYSLLVLLHSATTPVFEAPDEVWHYAFVRWLAEGNGLPPLTNDRSGANQQAAQPPLYYGLAALLSRPFADDDLRALFQHNPGFGYQAPTTSVDNKNMLIHPPEQAVRWRGAVLALHATRLTSWLFGLLTVCAAWGLGLEVLGNRRGALVTAALIAFQPQFVFLSGVVNNDAAAAALAALALWLGAVMLHRGLTWRRTLTAGGVAGLAALSKMSLLPVIPFLIVCLVGSGLLRPRRGSQVMHIIWSLMAFTVVTLAIAGWWYLRNFIQVGDLLGLQHHTATLWGRPEPASLGDLLPELPLLFRSFWAAYGWGHVTWPDVVYLLLAVLTVPCLAWTAASIVTAWSWLVQQHRHGAVTLRLGWRSILTESPLLAVTLSAVWFIGIMGTLLRWMLLVEAPHGRLLFPALAAWALLLSQGLQEADVWLTARAPRLPHPARVVLAFSAGIAILAPGARILATFAPPRLRSLEQVLATCSQPVNLDYLTEPDDNATTARLLCAEVSPDRAAPGETVSVRACWTAEQTMSEDYTVFVHLLGPENSRVAERHTYPGLGRFPTTLWPTGRAFCDTYTLSIAAWADTPIRYWLEIGLFQVDTGARLTATIEPPIVGAVAVTSPASDDPGSPLATFGGTAGSLIALTDYERPTQARPGDEIPITLHWHATGTPRHDYTAFVHLWRPGDALPLAQHDVQPRNNWYPTSLWQPGDRIPDTHILILPPTLPPGTYPLWVGLYNPGDNTRLPAFAGPPLLHDLVPLGLLEVRPLPEQPRD